MKFNLFDIVAILIILIAVVGGYNRGFIRTVASFVALVCGILGTNVFAIITADFMAGFGLTNFLQKVVRNFTGKVVLNLFPDGVTGVSDLLTLQENSIFKLLEGLCDLDIPAVLSTIDGGLSSGKMLTAAADRIAETITPAILNLVAWFITFVVVYLIVWLICRVIRILVERSWSLTSFDKVLGVAFGGMKGLIIVGFFMLLAAMVSFAVPEVEELVVESGTYNLLSGLYHKLFTIPTIGM